MDKVKNPIVDRTGQKYPAELLTSADITSVIDQFSKRYSTGIRNRALVTLMWRTGLRHAEVLNLRLRDVNVENNTVRVRHGKGNKARTVGLDALGNAEVRAWISRRAELDLHKSAPLFCTLKGQALAQCYIRTVLRKKAAKAGMDRRITPHSLRHALATEMVQEGHDLVIVQHALGHANPSTTDVYLKTLNGGDAVKALQARVLSPRAAPDSQDGPQALQTPADCPTPVVGASNAS